jgi:hypothetical protein
LLRISILVQFLLFTLFDDYRSGRNTVHT